MFIGLIIYGIIILVYLINKTPFIRYFLFIDNLLSITAFISLIYYIYHILDLLKPITIIKNLSKNLKIENILSHLENDTENEDPIQPFIDVLQISLIKYDYSTLKECLSQIEIRGAIIVNKEFI